MSRRQRQAVEAASRAGSFDARSLPQSTVAEVANAMDITAPTLHAHLRKAQATLLAELFTPGTIVDVHERTGGNPRDLRLECRELFTRATFVRYCSGQDVERIKITPELRERRFGIDR